MNSRTLWNDNWYFAKTALGVNWEDRTLWEREMQPADLPHDWLIYDTKNLYEDSIGWYRKKFVYSASGVKRAGEAAQENLREQPLHTFRAGVTNVSFCASRVFTWILPSI